MAVTLYVTRHGETWGNVLAQYIGSTDSPLTQTGRAQARGMRERLARLGIDGAYVSPLGRAQETAALMLDGLGVTPIVDERLREIDVGPMEGMPHQHAQARYPGSTFFMERPSAYIPPPGAEPPQALLARVGAFLSDMTAQRGRTLLAVTHGYAMRAFHAAALGDGSPLALDRSPRYGNAELICFVFDQGRWRERRLETDLYLVRHGKTLWNQQRRIQGWGDSPLTQEGLSQARALGERIASLPLDAAYSSPAQRALHTARLALGGRDVPLIMDDRLRERGMGILEGVTLEAAPSLHPGFENYETPPQGETIEALRERLASFMRDMTKGLNASAIAFSHALSIRWILAMVLDDGTHAAFLRTPWLDNSVALHLRCVDGLWQSPQDPGGDAPPR